MKPQIWFLTGSQHLYGEETLAQVADQSAQIQRVLAEGLSVELVAKPVLTVASAIRQVMQDANNNPSKQVSDIGARLAAGQKVVVDRRVGDWVAVWYLGDIGWVHSPKADPVLLPSDGATVSIKPGAETVPVYGRAYPEPAAYEGTGVPVQAISPLVYTIKPGQAYSLSDSDIESDYYRATTYDWSSPGDGDDVEGQIEYYQIWFGHRMHYVMADDVVINR